MNTALVLLALAGATYLIRRTIMATTAEVVAQLQSVNESLTKVAGETTALVDEVARLTDLVNANGEIPEEISTLVNQIQARVQGIDELVADVPAPPPVEPSV